MGRVEPVQGFEISGALLITLVAFGVLLSLYCLVILVLRQRHGLERHARPLAIARAVLATAGLLISAALLSQWLAYRTAGNQRVSCVHHAKNLAVALSIYATDYDAFPTDGKWCDALSAGWVDPRKMPNAFVCPARPDLRCGYAVNSALFGLKPSQLDNSASMVGLFESDAGWNAHGGPELLPKSPRHFGEIWVSFGWQGMLMGSYRPEVLRNETEWLTWKPTMKGSEPITGHVR